MGKGDRPGAAGLLGAMGVSQAVATVILWLLGRRLNRLDITASHPTDPPWGVFSWEDVILASGCLGAACIALALILRFTTWRRRLARARSRK